MEERDEADIDLAVANDFADSLSNLLLAILAKSEKITGLDGKPRWRTSREHAEAYPDKVRDLFERVRDKVLTKLTQYSRQQGELRKTVTRQRERIMELERLVKSRRMGDRSTPVDPIDDFSARMQDRRAALVDTFGSTPSAQGEPFNDPLEDTRPGFRSPDGTFSERPTPVTPKK